MNLFKIGNTHINLNNVTLIERRSQDELLIRYVGGRYTMITNDDEHNVDEIEAKLLKIGGITKEVE